LIKYGQWRAIFLLIICCTFIACSSEEDEKNAGASGASDTGVTAPGTAAPTSGLPANYGGAVDTINCYAISGWIWNSANPAEKIDVDILIDNKLAATTPANIERLDLKPVSPTPNFAFRQVIPPQFMDGKPHTVSARVAGSTHEVKVWEKIQPTFTCKAP
jgi:hypothetical protein